MATISLALPILGLVPDDANPPGLGWEGNIPHLLLDDTTAEPVYVSFRLPDNYTGAPKIVVQYAALSATSGTMGVEAQIKATSDGEDPALHAYDALNTSALNAVPATTGQLQTVTLPLTYDSLLVAGDLVHLKIQRALAGTATGDMIVHSVSFGYDT